MATKTKALTEDQKREVGQIVRKQVLNGFLIMLALLGGIAGYSLWDIKTRIEKKAEDLVSKQFEEPRIKEIVENAAKNRASVLMSEQINPEIVKFKEDIALKIIEAEGKLSEIDAQIRDANENIKNMDLYTAYYLTVLAAQGNVRKAYDQLNKWASDNSFPLHGLSSQVYDKIMDDHSGPELHTISEFHWKEGVDPNKLTLEQLKQEFSNLNLSVYQQRALLEYIWKRNDIPKKERLDFFADIMRNDDHLMVCEYAGRYFIDLTGLKIKPLALDYLSKWWTDNKDTFEAGPDPNLKK